jgi:autotransporter-associated beta strand protein
LLGNNATVGSLVLSNYSADAAPSILDTGSTLVGLTGGIIASVDNDHVNPIIKGRLNLNGFLPFNISGGPEPGLEILAAIGGNGFQKIGTGTLRLTGNNTFSGDAEISAGTVEADTATAFGQAGPTYGVELSGGNLVLQRVAIGAEPLFVNSAVSFLTAINQCSWAGPVTLNADLNVVPLDVTASGLKLNFSGSISGSGGLNLQPALFGVGNVQLSGPTGNFFTGPTTVNCQLLELNKPSGVNAYAGRLIVGGAAGSALHEARWLNSYQNVGANLTLYANGIVNLNNYNEDFGPVTFNGGEVDTGTGQFAIYAPLTVNPAASSAVINGYLGLPPGDNRVFIVGDGASDCDLLVNAVVFGSPGTYFVKQGAGTMCLANANTFNAPTLLETGILDINSDAGLGTWPGLIIFDGATLRISGPGNTGGGVEVVGAGLGGTHGAIEVLPGNSFTISGSVLLDASTTLNLGGTLGLNGVVSGTGPLNKTGTGALVFGGAVNNTYSGDTVVSAGSLLLNRTANKISVPGNLVIGPGPAGPTTFARLVQTGGIGGTTVSVDANSLFDLNGYYQALTSLNLKDGGSVHTGAGLLDFPSGGAINVGSLNAFGSHVSAAITGTVGLPPNATLTFNINPFAPFFPFASGPELDVQATIPRPTENLGFAPAGITKNGDGQMRLSGNNTYAGSSFINDGTLTVDGTQPQSPILVNSGTLGGSGTVGHIYMSGGVVAPGDAGPGILTCSNLNAGISASGVLRLELNGSTAGSGYDQLNVRGTVNLAGVALERSLGFSPPTGTQFDIISNDGNDAVTGTFNGLPDSGKFYMGGVLYQINYRFNGRPGNDVALQGLDTPPPPTLLIEKIPPSSVRLLWPTNDPPFSLQTAANLPATNWLAALPFPVVIGTNNVVTNTATNLKQFYRLSNP